MRSPSYSHEGKHFHKKRNSFSSRTAKKARHNYIIFVFAAPIVTGLVWSASNFNDAMQAKYDQTLQSFEVLKQDFWKANSFCKKFVAMSEKDRINQGMYTELKSIQKNIDDHQVNFIVSFGGVDYFFNKAIAKTEHTFTDKFDKEKTMCGNLMSYDELNQWQQALFDPMKAKLYNLLPLMLHLFVKTSGLDLIINKLKIRN